MATVCRYLTPILTQQKLKIRRRLHREILLLYFLRRLNDSTVFLYCVLEKRSFGVLACVKLSFDKCTCISCHVHISKMPPSLAHVAHDYVGINVAQATFLIICLNNKIPSGL